MQGSNSAVEMYYVPAWVSDSRYRLKIASDYFHRKRSEFVRQLHDVSNGRIFSGNHIEEIVENEEDGKRILPGRSHLHSILIIPFNDGELYLAIPAIRSADAVSKTKHKVGFSDPTMEGIEAKALAYCAKLLVREKEAIRRSTPHKNFINHEVREFFKRTYP